VKLNEIVPGRLYVRGEYHQLDGKLEALEERNIRIVVSLVGDPDPDLAPLEHYHVAIPDGLSLDAPLLLGLARAVALRLPVDAAAVVNCRAGRNRSALLAALIARELLHLTGREALELVRERRPGAVANEVFAQFLHGLPPPPPLPARHLLYLIGQPGSGKSSLVTALTDGLRPQPLPQPFARLLWGPVVELGARRDAFAGTDALGMSVQPRVVSWLQEPESPLVLGEGDRLGNGKFFTSVLDAGWGLRIAWLAVSARLAERRRADRAAALGSRPQNPAWLKGRISKVARLAAEWEPYVVRLEADASPDRVLAELVACGDPVAAALRTIARPR
jgi:hypothetical protein